MSYNAIIRSKEKRVWAARLNSETMDADEKQKYQGWEVGTSQGSCIGIPARLVRKINERTTPLTIENGVIVRDDRNLVVFQNTLSGVGRYRSQFNVDADGIVGKRYYIEIPDGPTFCSTLHNDWSYMFLDNKPNSKNLATGDDGMLVYQILFDKRFFITNSSYFGGEAWIDCSVDVTDMQYMFQGCYNLMPDSGFSLWNPLLVTNMQYMFQGCTQFEEDLGDWDITGVTNMQDMFTNTPMTDNTKYSQRTVSGWAQTLAVPGVGGAKPAKVFANWHSSPQPGQISLFSYVFFKNHEFIDAGGKWQQSHPDPIYGDPEIWAVSRLTNMSKGFSNKDDFNLNLSLWDTANVQDMSELFSCENNYGIFNNNGNKNINNWDVANVSTMRDMFRSQQLFTQPLDKWNTSRVTDMTNMFKGSGNAGSVNSVVDLNIGSWNVATVRDMHGMFSFASKFNNSGSDSIKNWNVEMVTDMNNMFNGTYFNQPIGTWHVGNVTNMSSMFQDNIDFNHDIGNWTTSSVTNMFKMFNGASKFDNHGSDSIGDWNVASVTEMSSMFQGARNFNVNLEFWTMDVTHGNRSTMIKDMFDKTSLSKTNNDRIWNSWIALPNKFLESDLKAAKLRHPKFNPDDLGDDWSNMFINSLTNTANLAMTPDGQYVWYYLREENNISYADQEDYTSWNDASKDVTDMGKMFLECTDLQNKGGQFSGWNTTKVTDMHDMFNGVIDLNHDLGGWTINSVTNICNRYVSLLPNGHV